MTQLKRLPMFQYETGDGQLTTSEYTWEDFKYAERILPAPTEPICNISEERKEYMELSKDIVLSFKDHTEKAVHGNQDLASIRSLINYVSWSRRPLNVIVEDDVSDA